MKYKLLTIPYELPDGFNYPPAYWNNINVRPLTGWYVKDNQDGEGTPSYYLQVLLKDNMMRVTDKEIVHPEKIIPKSDSKVYILSPHSVDRSTWLLIKRKYNLKVVRDISKCDLILGSKDSLRLQYTKVGTYDLFLCTHSTGGITVRSRKKKYHNSIDPVSTKQLPLDTYTMKHPEKVLYILNGIKPYVDLDNLANEVVSSEKTTITSESMYKIAELLFLPHSDAEMGFTLLKKVNYREKEILVDLLLIVHFLKGGMFYEEEELKKKEYTLNRIRNRKLFKEIFKYSCGEYPKVKKLGYWYTEEFIASLLGKGMLEERHLPLLDLLYTQSSRTINLTYRKGGRRNFHPNIVDKIKENSK